MKQRITSKDIKILTEEQKRNLTALWVPGKYDVAVANICKDIENEEFEEYEFVIGNIEVFNGYRLLLHDIKALNDDSGSEKTESGNEADDDNVEDYSSSGNEDDSVDDEDPDYDEEDYNVKEDEETEDFDIDFNYSRPASFIKDECTPLLNIGQMIEILQKKDFGKSSFHLSVFVNEKNCEFGKDNVGIDAFERGFEEADLCDVLWEAVKSIL